MNTAFHYLKSHNIMSLDAYPYAMVDQTCQYDVDAATDINTTRTHYVGRKNPSALKEALKKGPVSISMNADMPSYTYYSEGIYNPNWCIPRLNHAVLAVGWGIDEEAGEFWIVKNSFSADWGDKGYIKLAIIEGKGVCGCQSSPIYADVTV